LIKTTPLRTIIGFALFGALLLREPSVESASGSKNGGGGGTDNTGANPGAGGTAANGTGLQAEATALVYTSASAAMDSLVANMTKTIPTGKRQIFVVNAPVSPQDILNLYAFEMRCTNIVARTTEAEARIKQQMDQLNSTIDDCATTTRDLLDKLSTPPSNLYGQQNKLTQSVGANPPPPAGTPQASAVLSEAAADATQIGTITQTVAAIANLIGTLNPSYTTQGGTVSTDDATLQYLLLPKLRAKYPRAKIVNYATKLPPVFESDTFKVDSFIQTFDRVKTEAIAPLNEKLSKLFEINSNLNTLATSVNILVASSSDPDLKKKFTPADLKMITLLSQQVPQLLSAVAGLSSSVSNLAAATYGFYDSILGGSGSSGGQPNGNPSSQPKGNSNDPTNPAPAAAQTTAGSATKNPPSGSQTTQPSASLITQSGTAASAAPFSRYAYVAFILDDLTKNHGQGSYKDVYLISVKAILAQGTDTTAKRFYIESYNALSSVARIYLQVTNLTTGECDFADEKESRGYQLYFPTRIRFQAEPRNKIPKWPEPVIAPAVNTDKNLYKSP
jgi:hypothetical protein